jgi:methyl-accepting chemotaxis protein
MKNTSIRAQVYTIVAIVLLGLAIECCLTVFSSKNLLATADRLGSVSLENIKNLESVARGIDQQIALVSRAPAQLQLDQVDRDAKAFATLSGQINNRLALVASLSIEAENQVLIAEIKTNVPAFQQASLGVFKLAQAFQQQEALGDLNVRVYPAHSNLVQSIDRLMTLVLTSAASEPRMLAQQVKSNSSLALTLAIIIALAVAITGLLIVRRKIVLPLNLVTEMLNSMVDQTRQSVVSIASSSQILAQGASEQAASLEESSGALEEITSLTKCNAERSNQAKQLANQARQAADVGSTDMLQMNSAMEAIRGSSSDIAKIIKTIDEIAFQTNLLALNAAVEAARAGEAGMGFAVVADEVRNLAQRSAQAAKETTSQIEAAVAKTQQGVQISTKVARNLQDIVSKVRQVDDLVAEVAAASQEQSQGLEQVKTAVAQMDKVTQSNAASAEESASAGEELSSQTKSLQDAVGQLMALAGKSSNALRENAPTDAPAMTFSAGVSKQALAPDAHPSAAAVRRAPKANYTSVNPKTSHSTAPSRKSSTQTPDQSFRGF